MAFALSEQSPWPAGGGQSVLFILDASNSLEQSLLEQWVQAYNRGEQAAPKIALSLSTEQGSNDGAKLQKCPQRRDI